jgi:hypothetical protein
VSEDRVLRIICGPEGKEIKRDWMIFELQRLYVW